MLALFVYQHALALFSTYALPAFTMLHVAASASFARTPSASASVNSEAPMRLFVFAGNMLLTFSQ
jgi:hypothetical protein